jgi:tetratricopeptide (TPR) repeat protein
LIPDHLQVCPFCKTSDDRNFRYRPNVEGAVITGIVAITLGVWIVAQSWVQPSHQSNPTNQLVYTELASELATSLRPGEKTIQPSAAARTELYTPKPFPDALLASPHEGSTAAHLQQPHLNTPEAKKEAQKGRIETQSVTIQAARSQQLNAIGFALMKQGRYEEATRVLMEAVKTFPESQRNLNYAYALYNLGRALRLAGHPDSAIPFLEERLKYNDQRDVVQRELIAARRDAGDPSAWGVRYE